MLPLTLATALLAPLAPSPGGWPYTLSPQTTGLVLDDCWPTLYFGPERVAEMRRKIDALPWARQSFEQLLAEAGQVIEQPPAQPIEPVGWRHDFYSRASGEHLVWEPDSPQSFLDPLLGGRETLAAQHRAWVLLCHEQTHRRLRSVGLLYALTGDERYAAWVAAGLRGAVAMFARRDLRNPKQEDALYFQPLYDAPALIQLAYAYALTRHSGAYQPTDHDAIRQGIFEEGVPYQMAYLDRHAVHNMTAYVAAAVAVCGQVLGRDDWVARGLRDGQTSLARQLTNGVPGEDGFWYEGTQFYHFYSACPLITLYELDRQTDGPNHTDPLVTSRLKAMLQAPLRLADGQGRLPVLGDLGAPGHMRLALYRHLYEYAAGQVDAGAFGPALAAMYSDQVPRNSLAALAFGPDELPAPAFRAGHDVLERPGFVVFRGPDERYLLFKAGPHGAGHDHLDKLELDLRAFGLDLASDPGTAGYALTDVHPFYRSTFSHNTLFVDEANQAPVKQTQLTTDLAANPPWARGIATDAYEGVELQRRVWFDPPLVVVLDKADSEAEHRYGLLWHASGAYSDALHEANGPELPAIAPLLKHLKGPRHRWTDGALRAEWRQEATTLRLLAGSDDALCVTDGETPYNPKALSRHTVALRAVGQQRRFWSILEAARDEPTVLDARLEGEALVVRTADGERRYGG